MASGKKKRAVAKKRPAAKWQGKKGAPAKQRPAAKKRAAPKKRAAGKQPAQKKRLIPLSEELVEVKEVFDHCDRNDNGFIEVGELGRLFEALGASPSDLELSAAVSAIDANSSGKISWEEFKDWWLHR